MDTEEEKEEVETGAGSGGGASWTGGLRTKTTQMSRLWEEL